jgi:hypothetical protein
MANGQSVRVWKKRSKKRTDRYAAMKAAMLPAKI